MPKIIIHSPDGAFDADARQAIVAELTDLALDCEALPRSPYNRSSVWTFFNGYSPDSLFMGDRPAHLPVVSMHVFAIRGGLDETGRIRLIEGATAILGRQLGRPERVPVHIVIHEVEESDWGSFGRTADLAALRRSPADQPAL